MARWTAEEWAAWEAQNRKNGGADAERSRREVEEQRFPERERETHSYRARAGGDAVYRKGYGLIQIPEPAAESLPPPGGAGASASDSTAGPGRSPKKLRAALGGGAQPQEQRPSMNGGGGGGRSGGRYARTTPADSSSARAYSRFSRDEDESAHAYSRFGTNSNTFSTYGSGRGQGSYGSSSNNWSYTYEREAEEPRPPQPPLPVLRDAVTVGEVDIEEFFLPAGDDVLAADGIRVKFLEKNAGSRSGLPGGAPPARRRQKLPALEKPETPHQHSLSVVPGEEVLVFHDFAQLGEILPDYVLQNIAFYKWMQPMKIQKYMLGLSLRNVLFPPVNDYADVIGIARTGSGKTLAFLTAVIALIANENRSGLQRALILAPTRELADQIHKEFEKLTFKNKIDSVCCYGGQPKKLQEPFLASARVVVGTPGRLADFQSTRALQLENGFNILVLDEADRMLDDGFEEAVRSLAADMCQPRVTYFFTATWPKSVQNCALELGTNPTTYLIEVEQTRGGGKAVEDQGSGGNFVEYEDDDAELTVRPEIQQEVVVFDPSLPWDRRAKQKKQRLYEKLNDLLDLDDDEELNVEDDKTAYQGHIDWNSAKRKYFPDNVKILIFVAEKDTADKLCDQLWRRGFWDADAIHGGRPQAKRTGVLEKFRQGQTRLLVGTDVIGRGLDIPGITHVIIYDFGTIEDYVHRVGRTMRGKITEQAQASSSRRKKKSKSLHDQADPEVAPEDDDEMLGGGSSTLLSGGLSNPFHAHDMLAEEELSSCKISEDDSPPAAVPTSHAITFFEYYKGYPHNARMLIDILRNAKQKVPPALSELAQKVANGERIEERW